MALLARVMAPLLGLHLLAVPAWTQETPVLFPTTAYGYPELRRSRETLLFGAGSVALALGFFLDSDQPVVPPQGLDPSGIRRTVDRNVLGNVSLDADALSDWTRTAAIVYPMVMAFITEPAGARWRGFGHRSVVYAETFLLSQGLTRTLKISVGRSRPYTYLAEGDRPENLHYDVTQARAFRSMPSGHASSAWTGSALAMTEYLLVRPQAAWWTRAGVGFVGGALAGTTTALRVQAGQHFPTDVLAGSAIGIASGVTLPLLHHGATPLPTRRAWLQMVGGALAGTLCGILVAGAY